MIEETFVSPFANPFSSENDTAVIGTEWDDDDAWVDTDVWED